MKPRLYDELIQTAVETSCFATGQSTIDEDRKAYLEWLTERDWRIAEKAWAEGQASGYFAGTHNREPISNPYRKENS